MKLLGHNSDSALARLLIPALAVGFAATAPANAATQGSIGSTSSGSVAITATVPNRALITNLADVTFTNADPSVAATNSQGPCVWSNTSTRNYTVTATGSGTSNAFTIASGSSVIPYSVGWANSAGASSLNSLVAGSASSAVASNATNISCGGSGNSTLKVTIAASDLQDMIATQTYTGTLTLVVTPQ